MVTPRLSAREKALRRIDRAYWRWMAGEDAGSEWSAGLNELIQADLDLDGCPPDCTYCSQFPWWRAPGG